MSPSSASQAAEPAGLPAESRLANVSAVVLVGGASRRMGRDKAGAEFAGRALATRVAELAASLFEEVLLVGGAPPSEAPGTRIEDAEAPEDARCALRGIVAGLDAAREARVLVLATDMPLLYAAFLASLVGHPEAAAIVPRRSGRPEPLCAVYEREVALPVARARLAAGPSQWKLSGLLDVLDTHYLDDEILAAIDPTGRALSNANTPEELRELEAIARG